MANQLLNRATSTKTPSPVFKAAKARMSPVAGVLSGLTAKAQVSGGFLGRQRHPLLGSAIFSSRDNCPRWRPPTSAWKSHHLSTVRTVAAASAKPDSDKPEVVLNKEFGYSRKDITLIGVGLFALGYAMYYGLQATGMEPGMAGNWVQLLVTVGLCVGWISTYLFRVATKQMTYVKQLEQYEDAVMRKRLEEMTPQELTDLVEEAEGETAAAKAAKAARAAQGPRP